MAYGSILQIHVVETEVGKKVNPNTGKPNEWKVARCNVLADDGEEVVTVGRFRVPRELEAVAVKGKYRCSFALGVPDWGQDKGDIDAIITQLTPLEPRMPRMAAPAPAPKAQ
ncbi:UNVERIFIED_ORG: hypothetical protein ABIC43_004286 [Variovorax guangxiensis]